MIYPAIVSKIICFLNDHGEQSLTPKDGFNKMKIQLDNMSVVVVDILSNDSEMNSLNDYLNSKTIKTVKSDKIKSAVADLMFYEGTKYENIIEQKLSVYGNDRNGKKRALEEVAYKIIKDKNSIKSTSIIRMALAEKCNNNGCIYNSKSIYVKSDDNGIKQYSSTGIYFHAISLNKIPVELKFIQKQTGEFVGYMKLVTSDLINSSQILYLLGHLKRTVEKKGIIPQFIINEKMSYEFKQLASEINTIKKNKENPNILRVIDLIALIKNQLSLNKKDFAGFKVELPFLIENVFFKSAIFNVEENKGKSPVQMFRDALINLNFSKENPEKKKILKKYILNTFLMPLANSQRSDMKLLAVYNIPSPNIFNESETWGFMPNNIDFSTLSFGIDTIKMIYNAVLNESEKE